MKTIKFFLYFLVMSMTLTLVTSCGDDEELPPIGGYNNADEVGSASLLAYFPFNGNLTETKSGKAPSKNVGNSFATGIKGQALNLANGYLSYPITIGNDKLQSFTISAWVNLSNNGKFTQILTLSETTSPDIWGNINLCAETGWFPATSDTLVPKILMRPYIGTEYTGQDNRPDPKGNPPVGVFKKGGKWGHIVAKYDGSTSKLTIFGDGVKISNPAWEERKFKDALIGNATFKATNVLLFGSMCSSENGTFTAPLPDWSKLFTGQMDEVRIFNKALSDADINSLYELEKAGR